VKAIFGKEFRVKREEVLADEGARTSSLFSSSDGVVVLGHPEDRVNISPKRRWYSNAT